MMASVMEVTLNDPFNEVRVVDEELGDPSEGDVLLRIERFGLATNNLAYALLGDAMGHWNAFPASPGWGRPPAWGVARVLAGDSALASPGDRLTGYLPMATHALVHAEPTESGMSASDTHRSDALPMYRRMTRTPPDPGWDSGNDDVDVAMLPVSLFAALLADDLINSGVRALVISSASSRSAAALARLLRVAGVRTTGLTSQPHRGAAESTGAYDLVYTYDDIDRLDINLDSVAYVDVAGSVNISTAVRRRMGSKLTTNVAVGGTHLRELPKSAESFHGGLPVARFNVGVREQEIVAAKGFAYMDRIERSAHAELVPWAATWLRVQKLTGLSAAGLAWRQLADGATDPRAAMVVVPGVS